MGQLRALTAEELVRIRYRFENPAPNSRIEAAKRSGVDLTLIVNQLRLSPAERVQSMLQASEAADAVRGLARRKKP